MLYSFILFIIVRKIDFRSVITPQDICVAEIEIQVLVCFVTTVTMLNLTVVLKHYINYHDNNGDAGKAIDETYGGQPIVSTQCGIFYDNDMEAISDMCCSPN